MRVSRVVHASRLRRLAAAPAVLAAGSFLALAAGCLDNPLAPATRQVS